MGTDATNGSRVQVASHYTERLRRSARLAGVLNFGWVEHRGPESRSYLGARSAVGQIAMRRRICRPPSRSSTLRRSYFWVLEVSMWMRENGARSLMD